MCVFHTIKDSFANRESIAERQTASPTNQAEIVVDSFKKYLDKGNCQVFILYRSYEKALQGHDIIRGYSSKKPRLWGSLMQLPTSSVKFNDKFIARSESYDNVFFHIKEETL